MSKKEIEREEFYEKYKDVNFKFLIYISSIFFSLLLFKLVPTSIESKSNSFQYFSISKLKFSFDIFFITGDTIVNIIYIPIIIFMYLYNCTSADMMKWMRDSSIMKAAWDKLDTDKKEDKFPIGVLYQAEYEDYTSAYDEVIKIAGGDQK